MRGLHGRRLPLAVLGTAVAALIASIAWFAGSDAWRRGSEPMMGPASRAGPVHGLADADRAAQRFADRWSLHVGETMRFSENYYAELLDSADDRATEVLIEPDSGTVHLEWGPAMMWNTAYGMTPARTGPGAAAIRPAQAVRIADQWLRDHRTDLHAAEPDPFPGYYTLHTLRGDKIVGMLSVNSATGAVWNHA
ncbi:hypothetical protein [Thermomonospora cellulosilytica]|uniref:Uncharacterized protein n=1 Tax=Thermomonospora cellulosilytica TaxID=1411118 RepID=A0A7W3R708_9ACTN|nr:hypothetical protein [Thermomonospora cellulosilytica]MBA9002773.1 hypothetical protein [Thermomonospora cellulosilytica]